MPGGIATTSLTVRNDSDIVEAYRLEVVGDCAAWTTVEPERVSLYPGTSETVTIRLAPPRSPQVRAGDLPLAVRVLPTEQPDAVRVPETTVHVGQFRELRAESAPKRRRGWLRGRYRLAVRNEGNAPVKVGFTPAQPGEELKFDFAPAALKLEPGESAEVVLKVRTGSPVWFGAPVTWPFTVEVAETGDGEDGDAAAARPEQEAVRAPLEVEFVQIPIFPTWLLAVLAALLALLLAWFMLVRPAVRSTAKEAAAEAARNPAPAADAAGQTPVAGGGKQPGGAGAGPGAAKGNQPGAGGGGGGAGTGGGGGGGGLQSSATIDLQTGGGQSKTGSYTVPAGKVFGITDLVVANFQGDEGVVTINFGDRKITTIALETFRNQDYHWVTPISITESQTVTVQVTCAKPGTPATGRQAQECHEVLNVSGVLSDLR
ncbi:hydrolytic protein [Streptomyces yangpuensis]|uniref:Hydrolytic protein n=2 Tax=Streptomyces TaxID=1883 RepID=A0ABY5Q7B3_9ACTN|nr:MULTISPECIES: hydrolytic protein [Streptomyces]MBZ9597375.1 hydrolytic protein [Streptomyces erythrochromogenes]UUY52067.1 hydrolytic protein [Streptomyces yangpuensis]